MSLYNLHRILGQRYEHEHRECMRCAHRKGFMARETPGAFADYCAVKGRVICCPKAWKRPCKEFKVLP